jgi:hypothetical protein
MVLRLLHRLSPQVLRFLCVEVQKRNSIQLVDSRDVHHCPVLFSRSTDFSSPLRLFARFGVRVYVSIVAGGSVTSSSVLVSA